MDLAAPPVLGGIEAQADSFVRERYRLDDQRPAAVFFPASPAQVGEVTAQCLALDRAVVPWGGGTRQHLGNQFPGGLMKDGWVVLDTTGLDRVIEYSHDDLIVTVQAGITVATLQKSLAAHGQFLPLDVPYPDKATIGGSLAVGQNGALGMRYGQPRDFTLGMQVANADGRLTRSGGRVVKNVAGYELPKLYIQSFGTLGIITEVTCKLFPLPAASVTMVEHGSMRELVGTAMDLWNSSNPPTSLSLFNGTAAAQIGMPGDVQLWARYAGSGPVVADGCSHHGSRAEAIENDAPVWARAANLPVDLISGGALLLRIVTRPSQILHTLIELESTAPVKLLSYPTQGIIYAAFLENEIDAVALIHGIRARSSRGTQVTIESGSKKVKQNEDIWAEVGSSLSIMKSLKERLDPHHILNPGRFVGGI